MKKCIEYESSGGPFSHLITIVITHEITIVITNVIMIVITYEITHVMERGVNAAKITKLQTLNLKIWIPKFQISLEWRVWSTILQSFRNRETWLLSFLYIGRESDSIELASFRIVCFSNHQWIQMHFERHTGTNNSGVVYCLPEIDLFDRQTSFLLSTDAILETEQFTIPDR